MIKNPARRSFLKKNFALLSALFIYGCGGGGGGSNGTSDPPDTDPTSPPDAGPTSPPDAGPTSPPDAGPTDPADTESTNPPDSGATDVVPSIVNQPQDATAIEGESRDFSVRVDSETPVTFRWRKNGVDIIGAINTTYTALQITLGESGDLYSVLITNSAGSVESNEAELTVLLKGITVDTTSITVDSLVINVA